MTTGSQEGEMIAKNEDMAEMEIAESTTKAAIARYLDRGVDELPKDVSGCVKLWRAKIFIHFLDATCNPNAKDMNGEREMNRSKALNYFAGKQFDHTCELALLEPDSTQEFIYKAIAACNAGQLVTMPRRWKTRQEVRNAESQHP